MVIAVHRWLHTGIRDERVNGSAPKWIDALGLFDSQAKPVAANLAGQNSRLKVQLVAVTVTGMFAGCAADALGYGVRGANIEIVGFSGGGQSEGDSKGRNPSHRQ